MHKHLEVARLYLVKAIEQIEKDKAAETALPPPAAEAPATKRSAKS
jgi:hypothetical protein